MHYNDCSLFYIIVGAMKKTITLIMMAMLLAACGSSNVNEAVADNQGAAQTNAQATIAKSSTATDDSFDDGTPTTPAVLADGKIHVDLDKLKTGVARADLSAYTYPFEKDSQAVQNYAKAYQITPSEAQWAMTLSMASPEALNKVLDQIVGEYVGHSLIDGKKMSLVIYTSDKVAPIEFDYVIADKFGEGLVLPVKVMQVSKTKEKPQADIRSMLNKFKTDSDSQ